jgi:hypothetical protein
VSDPDRQVPAPRRVRRGEGEVTQWPRGLVDYVATGPADATPSPEEDRTANRLRLAGRLLSLLRSQGRDVDRELALLKDAEAAFAAGDRPGAAVRVDRLFADLETAAARPPPERRPEA